MRESFQGHLEELRLVAKDILSSCKLITRHLPQPEAQKNISIIKRVSEFPWDDHAQRRLTRKFFAFAF